jgi:hypothetical protein
MNARTEAAHKATDAASKQIAELAEGEAIIERLREDLATRPKPKSLPVRKPSREEGGPSLMEMVAHILQAERAGRRVTAAVGLAKLKFTYEGLDASAGADWDGFVREHLEPALGLDRISKLIGDAVHRGSLLHCTVCSAEAISKCSCGAAYIGEHVPLQPAAPAKKMTALERAAAAVTAHPEKSDRTIAEEIGVSHPTVSAARRKLKKTLTGLPDDLPVGRIGRDGRRRRLPGQSPGKPAAVPEDEPEVLEETGEARIQRQASIDVRPSDWAEFKRRTNALSISAAAMLGRLVEQHLARQTKGRPPAREISNPVAEVNSFHREAVRFTAAFSARFTEWLESKPQLDSDGKAALMEALYLCADECAELAQKLDGR